jgi:hypothetical protein
MRKAQQTLRQIFFLEDNMKKVIAVIGLILAPVLFLTAQQPQPITNVITDTVSDYLSPLAGRGQAGEKLVVLHFKAPTQALGDWAIDRFTETFKQRGTVPLERRNWPAYLSDTTSKVDTEIDDAAAAALGARAGVRTVFTGAFSPQGSNWVLALRAVSVASKRSTWSKNYLIQPGQTFTQLAAQPAPIAAATSTAPAPVPAPAAPTPIPTPAASVPAAAPAAVSAPAAASASVSGPLEKGVYTFPVRPRAARAGVGVDTYMSKVEVQDDFILVYLASQPSGGGRYTEGFRSSLNRIFIHDLDKPGNDLNPVIIQNSSDNNYLVVSFERNAIRHFRFTDTAYDPNILFREITLGVPGDQK